MDYEELKESLLGEHKEVSANGRNGLLTTYHGAFKVKAVKKNIFSKDKKSVNRDEKTHFWYGMLSLREKKMCFIARPIKGVKFKYSVARNTLNRLHEHLKPIN